MTEHDDHERDCCDKYRCDCPADDATNDKDWDREWAANPGRQRT